MRIQRLACQQIFSLETGGGSSLGNARSVSPAAGKAVAGGRGTDIDAIVSEPESPCERCEPSMPVEVPISVTMPTAPGQPSPQNKARRSFQ